ncbi:MAG: extracellular solute-binding protein [Candidatus Magasanikbacteria bacterium]
MGKKFFLLFALLLVGIVSVGIGCKGLSAEEAASVRPVSLDYWTVYNDVDELKKRAAEYKALRPYVTVNIRQVRPEEFDKLFINALADDVAPDIISMHTRSLRNYLNKLSPMPQSVNVASVTVKGNYRKETIVTPLRIAMPSLAAVRSNYLQTVVDDIMVGGQIYGLPLSVDTLAIYYNKDLLDKAGIAEPPTAWGEFLEASQAATNYNSEGAILQSGVALGGVDNIQNAPDILAMFMMQNGIDMVKSGFVNFSKGLERPSSNHPALEALRFYADFAKETKEAYSWNQDEGDAFTEFTRGRSVFYFGFAYDYPRIQARAPQMNLEVIPVPQLNASAPGNVANYWIETVTKKSGAPDEAWDFIRFISAEEKVKEYTDILKLPSPYRKHIKDQQEDVILSAFTNHILTIDSWYRGRNYAAADRALRDLVESYLLPYGQRDNPLQRDANLIINAGRIIQQTL